MRKIVSQNGEIFFEAESAVNAIYFSASKKVGPFGLKSPRIVARIDEQGNIVCGNPDDLENKKQREGFYDVYKSIEKKYDKLFAIIGFICLFLCIPAMFASEFLVCLGMALFLICVAGSISAGCIGFFIEKRRNNKEMINVMKLHSAEHAVINAYYDLHRVPVLEEIRQYSNFSYGCGSLQKLTPSFWLCVIALCSIFLNHYVYIVGVISFVLFWKPIFRKTKPYFLEILVTDEPTDREYAVAIAGLEYSLKQIRDIDVEIDIIEVDGDEVGDGLCQNFSEEKCKDCPCYEFCRVLKVKETKTNA